MVKNPPAIQEPGFNPGLGRSPGEGNGNPLQFSCLENPHGQRSLVGYSPWGRKESDTTGQLTLPLTSEHSHSQNLPLSGLQLWLHNIITEKAVLKFWCCTAMSTAALLNNNQHMEQPVSTDEWKARDATYTHTRRMEYHSVIKTKEWSSAICNKDGNWGHYAQWNKSGKER